MKEFQNEWYARITPIIICTMIISVTYILDDIWFNRTYSMLYTIFLFIVLLRLIVPVKNQIPLIALESIFAFGSAITTQKQ